MKKSLFVFCIALISTQSLKSQCVFSCYNYSLATVPYSLFPTGGVNVIPSFAPSMDDGITGLIPIGFNFTYYCATYSNVLICSNGFLQFDINSPPPLAFANPAQTFPDPTSPNGIVALNMSDFDPGVGGSVTYTTIGAAPNRRFVLTYSNVPIWNFPTSLNSGQIVLFETSNLIEVHTATISNTSIYAGTQGIENPTGTAGVNVPGCTNSIWQLFNTARQFVPIATYTPAPPTTTITGPINVCQGLIPTYTINPSPGALSYNWFIPLGWIGTSGTTAITPTVGNSGFLSVTTTYSCGTSTPVSLFVNVNASPVISINPAPSVLCSGNTSTIVVTGANTYTLNPPGLTGPGPFTVAPLTSTSYSLTGIDLNGCSSPNPVVGFISVNTTPTITVNSGSICNGQSFTMTPTGAISFTYSNTFPTVTPSNVGIYNYTVIGSGTNNCVSTPVISTLVVAAIPTVTALSTRTSICTKESTTISANGASTYTWNTTSNNTLITVSPTVVTNYTVTGTSTAGCVSSGTISIRVSACTGIDNITLTNDIKVYPNPNNGAFTVFIESSFEKAVLEIYNSLGQLILSQKMGSEIVHFNIKDEANGLYYVKLKSPNEQKIIKIIKE